MNRRRGFFSVSLLELLIIILAVAIGFLIAMPRVRIRDREDTLRSQLRLLRNAIAAYHDSLGRYPASLGDLTERWHKDKDGRIEEFVYFAAIPLDPNTTKADWVYDQETGKIHSRYAGQALNRTRYDTW